MLTCLLLISDVGNPRPLGRGGRESLPAGGEFVCVCRLVDLRFHFQFSFFVWLHQSVVARENALEPVRLDDGNRHDRQAKKPRSQRKAEGRERSPVFPKGGTALSCRGVAWRDCCVSRLQLAKRVCDDGMVFAKKTGNEQIGLFSSRPNRAAAGSKQGCPKGTA